MTKKASEQIKYYKNPNGPVIGTVSRGIIEADGLFFKDLDGSGALQPYYDWRLPPEERAAAYVRALTVDEKIAQLFISDWRTGKYPGPGTLGIGAAVPGCGTELIKNFADCIRREWDAVGMKKGYMYMADVVTDPRWQRSYGTFGEEPGLVSAIMERLIPGILGSPDGVTPEGVAVTVKHFPGGGPRENGFDPHYAAVKYNASSVMPYYSKPAAAKSAPQDDFKGNPLRLDPCGPTTGFSSADCCAGRWASGAT